MRWVVILVVCLASIAAGEAFGQATARTNVRLTVTPREVLMDSPVEIRAGGLTPGRLVALQASTRDVRGMLWRSRRTFRIGNGGALDTRSDMRLFWSMKPVDGNGDAGLVPAAVSKVAISILSRGRPVATTTVIRRLSASRVQATELSVNTDGLAATFYAEPSTSPQPAVLQLSGSGGGHTSPGAALLASHGYPTLSLGYFGEPGLPRNLKDIPLEYFEKALEWMASQPSVDPMRITVIGVSRGGEAALLVAASYPGLVHGVVACTTASHVLGAFPPPATGAAWTINGNAILTGILPVNKITAPTLIYGGGKDEVIDSGTATKELADFARAHGRTNVTGIVYPNAGHGVGCRIPNLPAPTELEVSPGTFLALGGTSQANSQAAAASWAARLRLIASVGN
jgi:dienelactone hydrolase